MPLGPREYQLLTLLSETPNRLVRRAALVRRLWPQGLREGSNMLDVYIRRLRLKLLAGGYTGQVRTVRGRGYVLEQPGGEPATSGSAALRRIDWYTGAENPRDAARALHVAFCGVSDPRSQAGRRYRLPAILALTSAATLAGAVTLPAVIQWARLQPPNLLEALGFKQRRPPSLSMLQDVFAELDTAPVEAILARWTQDHPGVVFDPRGLEGGSGRPLPAIRLAAAYTPMRSIS